MADRISLKQAEISIEKFNQTVPRLSSTLRQHRKNAAETKNFERRKMEEMNAIRIMKQTKTILLDIEDVRNRLEESDLDTFDRKIEKTRQEAMEEIKLFLVMELKKPPDRAGSPDSFEEPQFPVPPLRTNFEQDTYQLQARAQILNEMEGLEREFHDVHDMFNQVSVLVHDQASPVTTVERNVEEAQVSVEQGETQLRKALKYKKAAYPLMGAIIGTCVAGPIGLVAGLKTGGLLAVGGGLLGFAGGNVLKKTPIQQGSVIVEESSVEQIEDNKEND